MLAGKKRTSLDGATDERAEDARESAWMLARARESSSCMALSSSWWPFTNLKENDRVRTSSKDSICKRTSRSGLMPSWGVKWTFLMKMELGDKALTIQMDGHLRERSWSRAIACGKMEIEE